MVMMVVMVLALTPPVDAGIRTECPGYNQSSMVSQQPLEMNKIGEGVMEARFQLLPPPDNNTTFKWKKQPDYLKKKRGECWVELSTNNDDKEENQKLMDHMCPFNLPEFPQLQLTVKCPDDVEQCATINFCNTESEATVKTPTHCNDYVGRVLTPWSITPSHNTISIILKITEWWMKIYQELEGNQQSLAADQQCPRGVVGFPYKKLRVDCNDGDYCGQVLSPPTITEYTN
ncbi:hypothetical protein Pcinc_013885, partial [Petrolisthes cinctipes]